jgi:hypothetical protein
MLSQQIAALCRSHKLSNSEKARLYHGCGLQCLLEQQMRAPRMLQNDLSRQIPVNKVVKDIRKQKTAVSSTSTQKETWLSTEVSIRIQWSLIFFQYLNRPSKLHELSTEVTVLREKLKICFAWTWKDKLHYVLIMMALVLQMQSWVSIIYSQAFNFSVNNNTYEIQLTLTYINACKIQLQKKPPSFEKLWLEDYKFTRETSIQTKTKILVMGQSTSGQSLASISIQTIPCQSVTITIYSLREK